MSARDLFLDAIGSLSGLVAIGLCGVIILSIGGGS